MPLLSSPMVGEDHTTKMENGKDADDSFQHGTNSTATLQKKEKKALLHSDYAIVLYYCYVTLQVPTVVEFHEKYRSKLGGRVRIAMEGLNGVLSGLRMDLKSYETQLRHLLSAFETSYELDVKYCDLRPEFPVSAQVFTNYSIQETKNVIQLVDVPSKPKRRNQKQSGNVVLETYQQSLDSTNAEHLSPRDWDKRLLSVGNRDKNIVLVDCRNSYESDIGHFVAPGATTVLTNTRKYSELPQVFQETLAELQAADEIFMYCTGGVRCERASGYLETLLSKTNASSKVYQLHGGIQRYLEHNPKGLFRGKNFVFDPRRVDPHSGFGITGQCLVCDRPHDDYDNGRPSCESNEARCSKCRVLILVCTDCRAKVSCWGENNSLPKLYCGGGSCLHRPPPRVIAGDDFHSAVLNRK